MSIEVLSQFLISKAPQEDFEVLRKIDGGGFGLPHFWIDERGHLMMKGVEGMFRINDKGHLEYVYRPFVPIIHHRS